MALADNPRLPLTSGNTPVIKYTEIHNETQPGSRSIAITAIPSIPASNRSKSQSGLPVNEYELRRMPTRQRRVVKKNLMANVGYRLGKRKVLHIRRLKNILIEFSFFVLIMNFSFFLVDLLVI
jgi:hypothetical protein